MVSKYKIGQKKFYPSLNTLEIHLANNINSCL
jgi:hypothetical protein